MNFARKASMVAMPSRFELRIGGKAGLAIEHLFETLLHHGWRRAASCPASATQRQSRLRGSSAQRTPSTVGRDVLNQHIAVARGPIAPDKSAGRLVRADDVAGVVEDLQAGLPRKNIERQVEHREIDLALFQRLKAKPRRADRLHHVVAAVEAVRRSMS